MNKKPNSAVSIYTDIKEKIIKLEYKPGEILNETQLAELYSVSRTPIREVLHRLQYDGLIKIFPKIGAQVIQLDLQYLKKSFDVKKALDALAVRIAVENATEDDIAELKAIIANFESHFGNQDALAAIDGDFHRKIGEIADNPVLNESLERIQSQLTRLWYYVSRGVLLYEEFHQDYVRIVDAIERKDTALAEEVAMSHVDVYNQQLRRELI